MKNVLALGLFMTYIMSFDEQIICELFHTARHTSIVECQKSIGCEKKVNANILCWSPRGRWYRVPSAKCRKLLLIYFFVCGHFMSKNDLSKARERGFEQLLGQGDIEPRIWRKAAACVRADRKQRPRFDTPIG